jgi:predicted AlkP superfamily phosphohydrolase/phosphomutase
MRPSSDRSPQRRVLVIGFDGATLDLIRPWAEAGLLPTFRWLMQQGSWGSLRSTMPPVTPTAWSSFITGMNPGKHGLFDFVRRVEGSYDTELVNATHRGGPSFWRLLSDAERRVIVFNVPVTYPPEPVNGLLVSGLLTPALATDATWPPELQQELQEAVPDFDFSPPGMYSRGQDAEFVRSVRQLNHTTLQATLYLMRQQPWDCLATVFMGTDIMSHFMWKHMENQGAGAPESVRGLVSRAIQNCYQDADAALAQLIEAAGDDAYLVVMSDHGFGPMERYMSVNAWLVERGYLRFKRTPASLLKYAMYRLGVTPLRAYTALRALSLADRVRKESRRETARVQTALKRFFLSFDDVDWPRTRAYSVGYAGPIFVNLKGREAQGIVEPGQGYEDLLEELTGELRALKDPRTGLPFVGEIHPRSDLYWGSHAEQSPDLMFMPRDPTTAGLGLFEFPSNRWLCPGPDRTGYHRMDGILFVHGPGILRAHELQGASIMDVAPTVLALTGVPIPGNLDGQVLRDAMSEALLEEVAITYAPGKEPDRDGHLPFKMADEDEEAVRDRLRGMGYVT